VRIYLGEPEVAIEHLAHAMRLSPLDPLTFVAQMAIAFAHFFAGRYDDASSWAEKALATSPPGLRERPGSCPLWVKSRHVLECALNGGQFQAAVLTGCWAC